MTALDQVNDYLKRVQLRLKLRSALLGSALTATVALLLTLLLILVADHYRFAEWLLPELRIALFGTVCCCLFLLLLRPVLRLTRRHVVRRAEALFPEFQERLLTVSENKQAPDAFTELLAEDALTLTKAHPVEQFGSPAMMGALAGTLAVCALALLWLIAAGPGIWGYGAALLWTGSRRSGSEPLYAVVVRPGNKTLRRNSDQLIVAQLKGFSTENVTLRAKYRSASKWEAVPMQANASGGYQFLFAGLSDNLDYFVQAGASTSQHFSLQVKDLPRVTKLRVALHFPSGIGLRDVVNDPGGDIRAVEGTRATVQIQTDHLLERGFLVMDGGMRLPLTAAANGWLQAELPILKDGAYHVAAEDGELIRISDDYFIEAKKDEPPTVRITRPGRDPHVSPIEEVPITVEAADDFGVHSLQLHYSVNGGPERVIPFPATGKTVTGQTMLAFENFNLQPGDFVSMYGTASDGGKTTRSDILFAQADAFDYKFRQSQQMGGGGQSGDDESRISDREKEIIAATWNEIKNGRNDPALVKEHAKFLSDLQGKLGEQAKAMADRMGKRELGAAGPQFEQFSHLMEEAANGMASAVEQLRPAEWQNALNPEQKSLQSLLRAEAIFRDIQVAFGQSRGSGSGSGGADRDLARLLDLELDTSKNQYESEQSAGQPQESQQKKLEDALQRLKELARRQQEMAENTRSQQAFQQRWEQEQLRREAEQLRQQMQQASGEQSNSNGQSSATSEAARSAGQSLQKAEEEMRRAASNGDESARKRAEHSLAEAEKQLENTMQSQAGSSLSEMARQSKNLADKQQQLAENVKKQYGAEGINMARPDSGSGQPMPEMNGPGYASWYRRRMGLDTPSQPATPAEKGLASEIEKLGKQTAELQRKMQDQVQQMAAANNQAARKLRRALSDAEQQELALRMQKGAEWLRSGHGSETWPLQDSITAGMQQFARQVGEAQQELGKGNGQQSGAERALDEVKQLQQQIGGGGQPTLGGAQQAMQDLALLGRQDAQLGPYTTDAIAALRNVRGQNGLLDARVNRDALRSLQRLEVELEKQSTAAEGGSAHTGANDSTPQQYKEAVAEYFRRLSK